MDHKERYEELIETIKILREEIESLRSGTRDKSPVDDREVFRKAFNYSSQLMAIYYYAVYPEPCGHTHL